MASKSLQAVTALPLTVENIVKHLQHIKNWRMLGFLIGLSSVINDIPKRHVTNEQCIKGVIQYWLEGKGDEVCWRRLIWALDEAGEVTAADYFREYSEPPKDDTLTIQNVTEVMKEVVGDLRTVWKLYVPSCHLDSIEKKPTSAQEKLIDAAAYYISYHPHASWAELSRRLFHQDEIAAVNKIKSLNVLTARDPQLTIKNVSEAVGEVEDWNKLAGSLFTSRGIIYVRDSKRKEIESAFQSFSERKNALIEEYVLVYPTPSWGDIANGLSQHGLPTLSKEVITKYIEGDERKHCQTP